MGVWKIEGPGAGAGWLTLLVSGALAACGAEENNNEQGDVTSDSGADGGRAGGQRVYQATAAVGDFFDSIVVDPEARTISYSNLTNGTADTVGYEVQRDGSYLIEDGDDPDNPDDLVGNLVRAIEVPGFALVMHATLVGPNADTASVVLGLDRQPIMLDALEGTHAINLGFKTTSGGIEVGYADIDASGNFSAGAYWPYAYVSGQPENAFRQDQTSDAFSLVELDPTGSYMIVDADPGEPPTYVFATDTGVHVVDQVGGNGISLPRTDAPEFSAERAGSYSAIVYSKTDASQSSGGDEGGTIDIFAATIDVGTDGTFAMTTEGGRHDRDAGSFEPVGPGSPFVGPGKLDADRTNGLFYQQRFSGPNDELQEDVFLSFIEGALVVAAFSHDTADPLSPYSYWYGYALAGP